MNLAPLPTAATPRIIIPTSTSPHAGGLASSVTDVIPPEMLAVELDGGTVGWQIDRSLRVRLEGAGPASGRTLVPETGATAKLMESPDGPKFERAVKSFLSVADAYEGRENLKTVTFLPDEKASKGVAVLNWATHVAQQGERVTDIVNPEPHDVERARRRLPQFTQEEITEVFRGEASKGLVEEITKGDAEDLAFSAAWNGDGHVVVMPDVSRDLLSTVGLYRHRSGDAVLDAPPEHRDPVLREAWRTLVHETHHSVTPQSLAGKVHESVRVFEEAIAVVLEGMQGSKVARRGGADIRGTAQALGKPGDPASTSPPAIDWPTWNRAHLPKPPDDLVDTADGRYVDGPNLVRQTLKLAGLDRRTREGMTRAEQLLQQAPADQLANVLAKELVTTRGLAADQAGPLAELLRQAAVGKAKFQDIERLVEAQPPPTPPPAAQ